MIDENSQLHSAENVKAAPQSTVRLGLWLSFLAFLLIVAVFHGRLSEIEFGEKGVSAKMASPEEASKLSPDQKKAAEQGLSERVGQLEQQEKAHPQSAPPTEPPANTSQFSNAQYQQQQAQPVSVNLTGYWTGTNGYTFQVQHNSNYVIVTSYYNGVRAAVAGGPIWGPSFTLQSVDLMSHPGTLFLQVSPNQQQMSGTYRDNATGQTFNVQMSR